MPDILVTTPRPRAKEAAEEAERAKALAAAGQNTGTYFRNFPGPSAPPLGEGDRLYYVLDGFVRGFLVVSWAEDSSGVEDTEGNVHRAGFYAFSKPESWQWIEPIPFGGFQGWRYADRCGLGREDVVIVGGWLDDMPEAAS
jgi:hypothetical protein